MRPLGEVIKELRARHGTQISVAGLIGISSQLLGKYEKGERNPKIGFFEKWKEVYGEDIKMIQKETNVSRGTKSSQKPSQQVMALIEQKNLPFTEERKILLTNMDRFGENNEFLLKFIKILQKEQKGKKVNGSGGKR